MPLPAIVGGLAVGALIQHAAEPGRAHFVPIDGPSFSPDGEPADRERLPERRHERVVSPPEMVDRAG